MYVKVIFPSQLIQEYALTTYLRHMIFDAVSNSLLFSSNNSINSMNASTLTSQSIIAGNLISGSSNGIGTHASFHTPNGICMHTFNRIVYVADSGNRLIRILELTSMNVSTLAGSMAASPSRIDGIGTFATFAYPLSLVYSHEKDSLYISDSIHIRILQFPNAYVSTLPKNILTLISPNIHTQLGEAYLSMHDKSPNIYISDRFGCAIRMLNISSGIATLLGGWGASGINNTNMCGYADGFERSSRFYGNMNACVDGEGNVFIADVGNNATRVVNSVSMYVTTLESDGIVDIGNVVGCASGKVDKGEMKAILYVSGERGIKKVGYKMVDVESSTAPTVIPTIMKTRYEMFHGCTYVVYVCHVCSRNIWECII
jgi:hypothetical protein